MVRNCPSPVRGESFTVKSMLRVGSSTSMRGRAIGGRRPSAIVSPMSTVAEPDDGDDVAGVGLVDLGPAELVEDEHAVDRAVDDRVPGLDQHDLLPALDPARGDPADGDPADVLGEVERRAEHLQRAVGVDLGAGDLLDDQVEQGLDVPSVAPAGRAEAKPALARGEDVGEVELLLVGAEFDEGVEDLVEDLVRPGVGPVDLVDDHDRPELVRERLAQHELRLRHRPLEGVDQHEGAVGHLQGPLDLAAEVGVAGGVDDVDLGRRRS